MRAAALLLICLALPARASAAPPKLDWLFPAGAAPGSNVTVTLGGTFEKWPMQVWCDRPGIQASPLEEKGKLSVAIPADAFPGTVWIRVHSADGASSLRPFVIGVCGANAASPPAGCTAEVLEVEPNNAPATAQPLAAGPVKINGRFEASGDVDVYSISLSKGQTLVAAMDANRGPGSPMDGVLQVLSADGFVVEQNDDEHGLDPQVVWQAPADGQYLVRAFTFPAVADSTIALAGGPTMIYRLTITTGGFADHAWPLSLTAGKPSEIRIEGWNVPEAAQRLNLAPRDNQDVVFAVHPLLANSVRIPVSPRSAVLEQGADASASPQTVELPLDLSGRIDPADDEDAYAFQGKKGESWAIRVEAQLHGSPLDAVLQVTDKEGKSLTRIDDVQERRDPDVVFAVPVDGEFRIRVADLFGQGGPRFVYRLVAERVEPDFALSVTTDVLVATPGKPLQVPITIDRKAGFADEIEFTVPSLPAGVTAAPLKVAKGDAAKSVTLELTATAEAQSGPVRILGTAAERKISRPALSPVGNLPAKTADLWISVAPPAP